MTSSIDRRRFVAIGASIGTALLAGCTAGDGGSIDGSISTDSPLPGNSETGTFRLLISDQPADIADFDSLDVTFDRARVFRGEEGEDDEEEAETPDPTTTTATATETTTTVTETDTPTPTPTPTSTPTSTPEGGEDDPDNGDGQRGFYVLDLEGATVDLTEVVGEKAISVFEGGVPEGRYTKIELYAADVGGVVDGESVEVKIPSQKLQIVKPFEVVAGEELSFVFDINVVKKGQSGGYNLLPVIAKSGVAGQDVQVEEVGEGEDDDEETETEETEDDGDEQGQGEREGQGQGQGDGQDNGPPDETDDER